MRIQPKYHFTATSTKQLKGGTIMTGTFTRIGTQPAKKGQMLTLADLRKAQ